MHERMRIIRRIAAIGLAVSLVSGCESRSMSASDMERAAVDHARQTLALGPAAKLDATVFVGKEVDGEATMCGFVRGRDAAGREIDPRQFVVTTDPVKWLVFQSVHAPSIPAHPDKFVTWAEVCGAGPNG